MRLAGPLSPARSGYVPGDISARAAKLPSPLRLAWSQKQLRFISTRYEPQLFIFTSSRGEFNALLRAHHLDRALSNQCDDSSNCSQCRGQKDHHYTDYERYHQDGTPLVLNDDTAHIALVNQLFHLGEQSLTGGRNFFAISLLLLDIWIYFNHLYQFLPFFLTCVNQNSVVLTLLLLF